MPTVCSGSCRAISRLSTPPAMKKAVARCLLTCSKLTAPPFPPSRGSACLAMRGRGSRCPGRAGPSSICGHCCPGHAAPDWTTARPATAEAHRDLCRCSWLPGPIDGARPRLRHKAGRHLASLRGRRSGRHEPGCCYTEMQPLSWAAPEQFVSVAGLLVMGKSAPHWGCKGVVCRAVGAARLVPRQDMGWNPHANLRVGEALHPESTPTIARTFYQVRETNAGSKGGALHLCHNYGGPYMLLGCNPCVLVSMTCDNLPSG